MGKINVVHFYMGAVAEAFREYREHGGTLAHYPTAQEYAKRELRTLRLAKFWANTGHTVSVSSERHQ
jgi:hypothetical protein